MTRYEWDSAKDARNRLKHGVSFSEAEKAFNDPNRVVTEDVAHSSLEQRYVCIGIVNGQVLTVRFTYRGDVVRIFGAGFWRKGRKIYERQGHIHG